MMTYFSVNTPDFINKLASQAFYGNLPDSNLVHHDDCNCYGDIAYRIYDKDAEVKIEFAVPGFTKEDFDIELDGEVLIVKTKDNGNKNEISGFVALGFEKRFKISKKINTDKINAHAENGILFLTLPKVEQAVKKPARAIEVA